MYKEAASERREWRNEKEGRKCISIIVIEQIFTPAVDDVS